MNTDYNATALKITAGVFGFVCLFALIGFIAWAVWASMKTSPDTVVCGRDIHIGVNVTMTDPTATSGTITVTLPPFTVNVDQPTCAGATVPYSMYLKNKISLPDDFTSSLAPLDVTSSVWNDVPNTASQGRCVFLAVATDGTISFKAETYTAATQGATCSVQDPGNLEEMFQLLDPNTKYQLETLQHVVIPWTKV
jgi:hypothetical protein